MDTEQIKDTCNKLPIPYFVLKDGKFVCMNEPFAKLVGLPDWDLIGMSFSFVATPESIPGINQALNNAENSGKDLISFEFNPSRDKRKWIVAKCGLTEDGTIEGSIDDITDYRESSIMLKVKEQQFNSLLDDMEDEVTLSSATGELVYANKAYLQNYGKELESVIGDICSNVVIPEDRYLYDVVKELSIDNPQYEFNCRVKRYNGDIRWLHCVGKGFFDDSNELILYMEVARDVTNAVEQHDELKNQNTLLEGELIKKNRSLTEKNNSLLETTEYLDKILNTISEGCIVINEDGEIEKANSYVNEFMKSSLPSLKSLIEHEICSAEDTMFDELLKGKSFNNREVSLSNGVHCLISGRPLISHSQKKKGVIIIKEMSKINKLINEIGGYHARFTFDDIITTSPLMIELINESKKASSSPASILIEGESGTGKELLAQSIHNASYRKNGPFVAVNCGAIPDELIESELFGYEEGAFTNAKKGGKPGKFELASGGTLFLDEISELPLAQQVVLLRTIQEKIVVRIGGTKEIPIDTRIICASNKDLLQEIKNNNFREDLYYRLNIINFRLPPLRDRAEDIPYLIRHFLKNTGIVQSDEQIMRISEKLSQYKWPGNIRELENAVQKAAYLSDSDTFDVPVPSELKTARALGELSSIAEFQNPDREKAQIEELLELFDGNISQTARKLGVSRVTLYNKINRYGISVARVTK